MKITRRQLRKLISEAMSMPEADRKVQYQVREGDSWWSITNEHSPGRSPEENAALNRKTVDDIIHPCDMLTIWSIAEYEGEDINLACL